MGEPQAFPVHLHTEGSGDAWHSSDTTHLGNAERCSVKDVSSLQPHYLIHVPTQVLYEALHQIIAWAPTGHWAATKNALSGPASDGLVPYSATTTDPRMQSPASKHGLPAHELGPL
jgi:hypothetical protein